MGKFSTPRKCKHCSYSSIHSSTLTRHMAACVERTTTITTPIEKKTNPERGLNATNKINYTPIPSISQHSRTSIDTSTPYSPRFMSNNCFHQPLQLPDNSVQLQHPSVQQAHNFPDRTFKTPQREIYLQSANVSTPGHEMSISSSFSPCISTPPSVNASANFTAPTTFDSEYPSVLRNEDLESPTKEKPYEGDHSPALFKLCVAMMEQVQQLNQSQQGLIDQLEQQSRAICDLQNQFHQKF